MYALFSAWKFYTKERVLLKKYLTECNVIDPNINNNLMSTSKMRENVAKCSTVKSEHLSVGTPFMS